MLRTKYWERDLVEQEVWLPNWRRHQVKAGAVRVLERGSRLRIPRRRASPMLKEQAEVIKCAVHKKEASKFCAWQNGEVSLPKNLPNPDEGDKADRGINIKKSVWCHWYLSEDLHNFFVPVVAPTIAWQTLSAASISSFPNIRNKNYQWRLQTLWLDH